MERGKNEPFPSVCARTEITPEQRIKRLPHLYRKVLLCRAKDGDGPLAGTTDSGLQRGGVVPMRLSRNGPTHLQRFGSVPSMSWA
jgi:hypothetical protein